MEFLNEIYTTNGRLNRLRYFKNQLILALASALISGVIGFAGGLLTGDPESFLVVVPAGICSLVAGIGGIMLSIRRLHDLNKSGRFLLLSLVPLVNIIFAFYLWLAPGTNGWNEYGADPLANEY
ncbi:MAG: DUF805 domain-containing protein [Selenomonadaceae bacterium]|nr:DUF805 domain-containing protein [Selenomonadaceae bacterium]